MRNSLRVTPLAASLLLVAPGAGGQKLSIGVVGGLSLTDDYRGTGTFTYPFNPRLNTALTTITNTSSHGFIIGPKLEVSLPAHFSFEVEALHRKRQWRGTSLFSPPVNFGNGPT